RRRVWSGWVSASPGPPLVGGGPSERKNFGSLTGDRYRPGCRESAACSAVVPALGTPATRKSGSAIVPPVRERAAFTTFLVILVSILGRVNPPDAASHHGPRKHGARCLRPHVVPRQPPANRADQARRRAGRPGRAEWAA